ncbi:MAG: rRNA maturation factor, partial [Bacteroidetes bacterium]
MDEIYYDIRFFSENIKFAYPPDKKPRLETIIKAILYDHEIESCFVNIIFCPDDYLLDINKTHLNHNYYTDIITFQYQEPPDLEGDIFISVDRVIENANLYKVPF